MSSRQQALTAPLSGAYIDTEALIRCRFGAAGINLNQRRRALSLLAGGHKTSFRGRGLDFAEVRAYQAGDDIRSIDWRVSARTGKTYTKLFSEEREKPVLVACDQRQGMFFGSRHCFKSVLAAHISATLAWATLNRGDRIGGLVFGNDNHREVRPKRSRKAVLGLIQQLQTFNQALNIDSGITVNPEQQLLDTLLELRRIAKPGHSVFLVSDFAGFEHPELAQQLSQLAKHCEVTGIFIYDPLEQQLPVMGRSAISDGRQQWIIDTHNRQLQQRHQQCFERKMHRLQQLFNQAGAPMIAISTDQAPVAQLQQYYRGH